MFKVCIIGCGMIANKAHIPALRNFTEDFNIIGVCDANETIAAETAKRHGIERYYTNAEQMLDEQKPDLAIVCAPNFLHKQYSMLALSYGANVLCEKPLGVTYADVTEMFGLAKSQNRFLMACQSLRFLPERLAAKELIKKGELGEIYYGSLSRIRRRGIPTWGKFHIKEFSGGGCLIDIGVHILDSLIWLMGNPKLKSVKAHTYKNHAYETGSLEGSGAFGGVHTARSFNPDEMDVEDFCSGFISFENNASVNFKVAWATNQKEENDMILSGTSAGISLPDGTIFKGENTDEKMNITADLYQGEVFPGHFWIADNIRKVLKGEADLAVKPEETLNVSAIIDCIYKSAECGKEVFFRD